MIGVGIVTLAVFTVILFPALLRAASGRKYGRKSIPVVAALPQPLTLYHGTSLGNALDIFNTGLWLIGTSSPRAVWFGNNIDIARKYSKSTGAIVVVNVDRDVKLTNRGGGVYIYEVPYAVPHEEYYEIKGLRPAGVLTPQGNRIR
jgi:hypothetical protein